MSNLMSQLASIEGDLIQWRRWLHEHAEVGFDLPQTVDYVCQRLDELGITYQRDVGCPCSVVAEISGAQPGKTLALRADMDALPVQEETGLAFSCKTGNMHACGHDAHTAILLAAAKALMQCKDQLKGRVKLIFQPAEELGSGAKGLCEAGVLDGVDEILGLHVGNITEEGDFGQFFFASGSMMACMDKFRLKVKGKGAHGAYPARSVDPIVAGAYIVTALQEIMGREIEPVEPAVITVGAFHAGTAFNIIPEFAVLEGTVRALNEKTRQQIARRIEEVAKGVAGAMRADVDFEFFFQPPPLVNNKTVVEKVMATARELFGDEVRTLEHPVMGGEDFAYYLEKVPGTFVFLSNPRVVDGQIWPHHNSKFDIEENQLLKGVALFVAYAQKFLA